MPTETRKQGGGARAGRATSARALTIEQHFDWPGPPKQGAPDGQPYRGFTPGAGSGSGSGGTSSGGGGGGAMSSSREQKVAEAKEELKIAKMKKRSRRNTVCAVPVTVEDGWQPPVHPKTDAERARVAGYLRENILFKGLDPEEHGVVVDAVERRAFPAGHTILRQGDIGDYYYVVDDGLVEIFVDDVGKVQECGAGASFGELALMYDAPRAATVVAATACNAWALDQTTFKKVMMDVMTKKRELHEGFINKVELFAQLDATTKRVLADALSSATFAEGQEIIREGDDGGAFFIIESGAVQCTHRGKVVSRTLRRGDYFGPSCIL